MVRVCFVRRFKELHEGNGDEKVSIVGKQGSTFVQGCCFRRIKQDNDNEECRKRKSRSF
jgi:hypothetical protein